MIGSNVVDGILDIKDNPVVSNITDIISLFAVDNWEELVVKNVEIAAFEPVNAYVKLQVVSQLTLYEIFGSINPKTLDPIIGVFGII